MDPTAIIRGTELCGSPIEEVGSLLEELRKIPVGLADGEKALKTLSILERLFAGNSLPKVGGCHSAFTDPLVDPDPLAALVSLHPQGLKEMSSLAKKLRMSDYDRARWYAAAAKAAEGGGTAEGKKYAQEAYRAYSRWYSKHTGDEKDKKFSEVAEAIGQRPEPFAKILEVHDECDLASDFSLQKGSAKPEEQAWLGTLLNLAFVSCKGCVDPNSSVCPDRESFRGIVRKKPVRTDLEEMLKLPRFRAWLGKKGVEALEAVLNSYNGDFIEVASSDDVDACLRAQDRLEELLLHRFEIRKRTNPWGTC